jgi:ADP-ribose pyrophosphatase
MPEQRRRIYTGDIVTLDVADVLLPNGNTARFEIVGHPGGAAIVALNVAGEVCLLRQFRPVAGGWMWELPAGKLDGKSPDATARAELAEEAGLEATRWQSLGQIVMSPGVYTEVVHLFLAEELIPVAAAPERDEIFEVHWLPLAEALRRALEGELVDAKTIIALQRAAHRKGVQAG